MPQDDFLFHLDSLSGGKVLNFFRQRHLLVGILLIVVGIYMLAELILPTMFYRFNIDLYPFFNALPTIVVAAAIIWLGIRLIRSSVMLKAIGDDYQELPPGRQIAVNPIRDASCRVKGRPFFLP